MHDVPFLHRMVAPPYPPTRWVNPERPQPAGAVLFSLVVGGGMDRTHPPAMRSCTRPATRGPPGGVLKNGPGIPAPPLTCVVSALEKLEPQPCNRLKPS